MTRPAQLCTLPLALLGAISILQAAPNTILWSKSLGGAATINKTSPVIAPNGNIYVGGPSGVFYAVNPANGNTVWSYTLSDGMIASPIATKYNSALAVTESGKIYYFSPSGSQSWPGGPFSLGAQVRSSPALSYDELTLLLAAENGALYKVYIATSSPFMVNYATVGCGNSSGWATEGELASSPSIAADGTVYVSGNNYLWAFNSPNWNSSFVQKWKTYLGYNGALMTSPSIRSTDGMVFVGDSDGSTMDGFRASDGAAMVSCSTGGEVISTSVFDTLGNAYFGGEDQFAYSFDTAGSQRWSFTAPSGAKSFAGSAALSAASRSWQLSNDGILYCFDSSGSLLTSVALVPPLTSFSDVGYTSSPVIASNGNVLVIACNTLFCIQGYAGDGLKSGSWSHWRWTKRGTGNAKDPN